ncbi:MAG TPA: hypothetical protein VJC00_02460, partial [Candidatus Nanoarchaeia archaeon]|nr:hypothetical protein [Candidatus Nanoarchaeia archaeon]
MPSKKRKRAGKAKAMKPVQKKKPATPEAKKKKTLLQKPRFKKAPSRLNSIIIMILDGWGIRGSKNKNAIKLARTPNMDFLAAHYPSTKIEASGSFVGLPKGQMGNSEVGHMNIGAGRIVGQEFVIISKSIKNGSFYRNKNIIEAFK